jgi:hypothetical protein
MYRPRFGSVANECTETSTPERTRKVPTRLKREGEDRQQQRPALEDAALLRDASE